MSTAMSNLFGRTIIYADVDEITSDNIVNVINDAYSTHTTNANQIDYLYNYYKGDQPIYSRTKEIRDDIVNIVCENNAKELVDFKVGYQYGEPIQYVARSSVNDNAVTEKITTLNQMMRAEEMEAKNVSLGEWQFICGTAYKMVLQNETFAEDDHAPFSVHILEPDQTFVIYSSGLGHKPLAGVYFTVDANDNQTFHVYTDTEYFKLQGTDLILERGVNGLGGIPIIEYPLNDSRVSAIEAVLPIFDAINELNSDRIDGIDQFIQSLVIAVNCEFKEDQTFSDIIKSGIVALKSYEGMNQDIKILSEQLNQTQTQTLKDDLEKAWREISAMPNRNGGTSTSDTGVAVIYRDGWSSAESDAKRYEMTFKKAEREFLKRVLTICRNIGGLDINQADLDIHFDRRNYENIEMKANVLTTLLNNDKVAPRIAFEFCNMFPDSEQAYQESLPYIERALRIAEQSVQNTSVREDA